ncbi:MAG: hypothetical protein EA398_13475 [Deltaproteobacteria bacterium]|nr:MAG: hypothetical protein EA398_13475 [Deltaproteobacteria bacterium]
MRQRRTRARRRRRPTGGPPCSPRHPTGDRRGGHGSRRRRPLRWRGPQRSCPWRHAGTAERG